LQSENYKIMAEKTLEERLSELYEKIDHRDQFFDKDLKTLIDGIRDAREHGGTASVDVTPIVGGYKIVITDSEGVEHVATVKDGGDAYEVYKSTVQEGQSPMTKEEWLETLKGADGADGADGAPGHNPCLGRFPAVPNPMPNGQIGDYLYVDITTVDPNTQEETTTTTVYHYCSNGWDGGAVIDAEHPILASGQSVTSVHIKDLNGDDDPNTQGVLSAEAGKELFEIDKDFDFVPVEDSALGMSETWQFGSGTNNTFSGDGLNGTFTVVTGGNQPVTQRPYIVLSNVVTGHYYRLKCHIINNSNRAFNGFTLGNEQRAKWSYLTDIYGRNTKNIPANGSGDIDAIFVGDAAKNYLLMTFDSYTSNDTLEMSNFSLTEIYALKDAQSDIVVLKETALNVAGVMEFKEEAETGRTNTWAKVFEIADAAYKARLNAAGAEDAAGTRYVYIFEVTDYVDVRAYLMDSNYQMYTSVFDTLNGAKKKTSEEKHNFGNGMGSPNNSVFTNYKDGRTPIKSGWLLLEVTRTDNSAITDTDITTFEQKLTLEIKPAIESQLDAINERIDVETKKNLTKDDCYLYVCNSNGQITTSSNTRVKFIKDKILGGGKVISVDISTALVSFPNLSYGVTSYASIRNAKTSTSTDGTNSTIITAWESENKSNAPIQKTGTLCVFFRKDSSNSEFTPEDVETLMAGVTINVDYVEDEQDTDNYLDYDELPVGSFELTSNNTIAQATSVICVPYLGVKYEVEMPNGWQASIKYGVTYNVAATSSWVTKGNIELPRGSNDDIMCQKLQIKKSNGATITLNDVAAIIDDVHIRYKRLDGTILERNYQSEQYVKAAMTRLHYTSDNIRVVGGLHSMPVITHVSDLHGDMKRFENAVDYSKYIGADVVIASGDSVLYNREDGTSYLKDVIDKKPIRFVTAIGNHEVQANTETRWTNTQIFNAFVSDYVVQGDYKKDTTTPADAAYYYVDIANYNLRIIVLNQFNDGYMGAYGVAGSLGQTQITWFCNTLLSTPQDYGVIIVLHAQEEKASTPSIMSAWNQTVTQYGGDEDTGNQYPNGIKSSSFEPIRKIVDAFISNGSLNDTYTEGASNETITLSVDFSTVATGVEFICYLCGHRHKDNIGYIDNAVNPQLVLNIASSNCHYQRYAGLAFATEEDIPRGDRGVTQDAFNVYAIDRINKVVKIARVGSGVNFEGIERRFLIASYTTIPSNS